MSPALGEVLWVKMSTVGFLFSWGSPVWEGDTLSDVEWRRIIQGQRGHLRGVPG